MGVGRIFSASLNGTRWASPTCTPPGVPCIDGDIGTTISVPVDNVPVDSGAPGVAITGDGKAAEAGADTNGIGVVTGLTGTFADAGKGGGGGGKEGNAFT
jgi:hypothetical protein